MPARIEIPVVVLNPVSPYNPINGATVSVVKRTGGAADVWIGESGTAPEDKRTQPLSTDAQGRVQGWLDRGQYELQITIPGRPVYSEFIDATPAGDGGIDTNWLASQGVTTAKLADLNVTTAKIADLNVTTAKIANDGVTQDKIADNAVGSDQIAANGVGTSEIADGAVTPGKLASNVLPLGSVIDWWRASSSTPVPTGWAVCDGSAWSTISNDMGLSSGSIPNLVNKVTMGARLTVNPGGAGGAADGFSSSNGDAYTNAPGIGGVGGSNASQNFTHTHFVPGHYHSRGSLGVDSVGSHNHGGSVTAAGEHRHTTDNGAQFMTTSSGGTFFQINSGSGRWEGRANTSYTIDNAGHHTHFIAGDGSHSHSLNGLVGGTGTGVNGDSNTTTGSNLSVTDMRPAHVGMLKIMKVRNV